MKKRMLITGAAGFLGSHLCDRFVNEGYDVIGMDNLVTGDLQNIEHLLPLNDFQFFYHDVTTPVKVSGSLDYILHFASAASPADYLKIPINTPKGSTSGTQNLLILAKEKKARIVVASASDVYSNSSLLPQTEAYWGNGNFAGAGSTYGEAKRYEETLTMAWHTYYGVDACIGRIFSTYGPRMRLQATGVLPVFIAHMLQGQHLTIYGDGSEMCSFCYIDDVVEALYRLLLCGYNGSVNIGSPANITVKEVAEEIIRLVGYNREIIYRQQLQHTSKQVLPDISLARDLLQWQPACNIRQGVEKTGYYFKLQSTRSPMKTSTVASSYR